MDLSDDTKQLGTSVGIDYTITDSTIASKYIYIRTHMDI